MDETKNGLSSSLFPVPRWHFFLLLERSLSLFFLSFLSLEGPYFLESGSSNEDSRRLQNVTKSLIVPSWGSNPCKCMACCHLRGTPNYRRSSSLSVGSLVACLPGSVGNAVS